MFLGLAEQERDPVPPSSLGKYRDDGSPHIHTHRRYRVPRMYVTSIVGLEGELGSVLESGLLLGLGLDCQKYMLFMLFGSLCGLLTCPLRFRVTIAKLIES